MKNDQLTAALLPRHIPNCGSRPEETGQKSSVFSHLVIIVKKLCCVCALQRIKDSLFSKTFSVKIIFYLLKKSAWLHGDINQKNI